MPNASPASANDARARSSCSRAPGEIALACEKASELGLDIGDPRSGSDSEALPQRLTQCGLGLVESALRNEHLADVERPRLRRTIDRPKP